ncbi:MAG: hypothetical protein AAGL96_16705, partial [Pseudomonadota bacterium]
GLEKRVRYRVQTRACDGDPHNCASKIIKIIQRPMRVTRPLGASGANLTSRLSAAADHLGTQLVRMVVALNRAQVASVLPQPLVAAPSDALAPTLYLYDPGYTSSLPSRTPRL